MLQIILWWEEDVVGGALQWSRLNSIIARVPKSQSSYSLVFLI